MENKNNGKIDLDLIIEKYENNTLTREEILSAREEINNFPRHWMDLDGDNPKKELFIKTYENQDEFKGFVKFIKGIAPNPEISFISYGGSKSESFERNSIVINDYIEPLKELTKDFDVFDKFISIAYLASKRGIAEKEKSGTECDTNILSDFTKDNDKYVDSSRDGFITFYGWGTGRIHSRNLANAFNINDRFTCWDEETAIVGPETEPSRGSSEGWDLNWRKYIDKFLIDNSALKETPTEMKNRLTKFLETAEKLPDKFSDKELMNYLGVNNLFDPFNNVKNRVDIFNSFNPEKGIKNDDFIAVLTAKGGPSATRGWDIRISNYSIKVLENGKLSSVTLSPYYEFEDFPGGVTHWHKENELTKLISAKKDKGNYVVEAENEKGQILNFNLERDLTEELTDKVKELIQTNFRNWLNSNNLNPIAIDLGSNGYEGTYPYSIVSRVIDNKAYVGVVKVIDALRYAFDEQSNSGALFQPQFVVSGYILDGKTDSLQNLNPVTTQVYRNNELPCGFDEGEKRLFFTLSPEITVDGESVGVDFKLISKISYEHGTPTMNYETINAKLK